MARASKSITWVVDHFEAELAVIEAPDRRTLVVPRWALPPSVAEGDVLRLRIDAVETEHRRQAAQERRRRLVVPGEGDEEL
ncbi:MAG: DUF3006 domain-containing protein [Deinococcus sp.]|nr:DUF3006 domain-containing protein [Deinococcus sp.]